jgi:hypothetical protein
MTEAEVTAALPGIGSYFNGREYSSTPFESAGYYSYYWESEETGLSVNLVDGSVVAIMASTEFIVDGDNLIGLPADAAIWRAGGEISRDSSPTGFIETVSGIQLCVVDDVVVTASLEDYGAISD